MINNKKKTYNNRFKGSILNFVWNGIVITSTIGRFWFSADLIKNGIELDYDDMLNKLQELKNLKKKININEKN